MEEVKFNPLDYPEFERQHTDDGHYRMISVAEWLPPEWHDVLSLDSMTGELISVYYAPIYECFFSTSGGRRIELDDLDFWLKIVK